MKTDEQIKQNATEYAVCKSSEAGRVLNLNGKLKQLLADAMCGAFIAGAHSRDEEIDELEARIYALEKTITVNKYFEEAKLNQLRNPWISVEDRLPEKFKPIIAYASSGHIENSYWDGHYWAGDFYETDVTHWMHIPPLSHDDELINGLNEMNEHFKKGGAE